MVKIFRFSCFQISRLFWDLLNILRAAASCYETLVPVYQTIGVTSQKTENFLKILINIWCHIVKNIVKLMILSPSVSTWIIKKCIGSIVTVAVITTHTVP